MQGPVKDVRRLDAGGQRFLRLVVTMSHLVYANENAVIGSPPAIGEDMRGQVWLQGCLAVE